MNLCRSGAGFQQLKRLDTKDQDAEGGGDAAPVELRTARATARQQLRISRALTCAGEPLHRGQHP